MNVGYGHSITELESQLIISLKYNKKQIIFIYIILFYIMICQNALMFLIYYYLS